MTINGDRPTPVPPIRVKLSSGTLERPGPNADARDWAFYFATIAIEIEARLRRSVIPRWHGFAAILGVVGFAISVAVLAWHICTSFGHCR
jgi:hypothetical protein